MNEPTTVIASPSAEVLPAQFDYAALDTETRIVVQQRTSEIRTIARRAAADVIEIGQKLIDVKTRLGHGKFGQWLQAEFSWQERTAQSFMAVADRFKSANFADLNFAPSALYMLAAPSVPEPARAEAIQRAEAGERIGVTEAKAIIGAHAGDRQYAAILDLVPGVRAWLASVPAYRNNVQAQRDVLNQIKIQSPAGREQLAKLMSFSDLPRPNRASDVVAACRQAFDDINTEAQARNARVVVTDPAPDAPARAPIYELERALDLWLAQLCAIAGEKRVILEDIKARRDPWYSRLFAAATLPPNRTNGDVLQAAHNLLDHLNQAEQRAASTRVVATAPDAVAAHSGALTVAVAGTCRKCGRPLTDPAHVAAGCGPVCAAKAAANGGNGKHAAPISHAGAPAAASGLRETETPVDLAAIVDAWLAQKVEDNDLPDDREAFRFALQQVLSHRTAPGAAQIWKDFRTYSQWPPDAANDAKLDAARSVLARLAGRPLDTVPAATAAPQILTPIDLAVPPEERDKRRIRQLERALAALIEFVKAQPVPGDLADETNAALQAAALALHDVTYA